MSFKLFFKVFFLPLGHSSQFTWTGNSALFFSPFISFLPSLEAESPKLAGFTCHVPPHLLGQQGQSWWAHLSSCLHPWPTQEGSAPGKAPKLPQAEGLASSKPDTRSPGSLGAMPMALWFIVTIRMIYLSFQAHFPYARCWAQREQTRKEQTPERPLKLESGVWEEVLGHPFTSAWRRKEPHLQLPIPKFPSRAQEVPLGFGGVLCHFGRQQKPQSLAASTAFPWRQHHWSTSWRKETKKKKYLKSWKKAASEHRAVQSRKWIHNSWNLAPFYTTDCSVADVKCIYGVGTFPGPSWGLGKISGICLRETVAWLEMKSFFHIYNSSFHLP